MTPLGQKLLSSVPYNCFSLVSVKSFFKRLRSTVTYLHDILYVACESEFERTIMQN